MPKRRPASGRNRHTTTRRKPLTVFRPAEPRPQTAQQQTIAREEDAICKRIVEELGFSPESFSALREFRQMHSPDVGTNTR